MGGTPLMELYILNYEVTKYLRDNGIWVQKNLVGNFMTSLEMQGGPVTLLKLNEEMKMLLNEPCDTPALKI